MKRSDNKRILDKVSMVNLVNEKDNADPHLLEFLRETSILLYSILSKLGLLRLGRWAPERTIETLTRFS